MCNPVLNNLSFIMLILAGILLVALYSSTTLIPSNVQNHKWQRRIGVLLLILIWLCLLGITLAPTEACNPGINPSQVSRDQMIELYLLAGLGMIVGAVLTLYEIFEDPLADLWLVLECLCPAVLGFLIMMGA